MIKIWGVKSSEQRRALKLKSESETFHRVTSLARKRQIYVLILR